MFYEIHPILLDGKYREKSLITETASGQIIVSDREKWNAIVIFRFFFFFVLSLRFTNVYQTQELANKRSVCSLPETIFIKIFFETLQRYLYYPECYINSSSFTYYHLYLHRYTERKKNRHFRVDNLYIYIYVYIILDCLFLEIQGEILVISVT